MSLFQVPIRQTTTTVGTTLVAGITQPHGLAPLDLLSRYPLQSLLLQRFSPGTISLDRYFTPVWLPFALIGCTVCAVVYGIAYWRRSGTRRIAANISLFDTTTTQTVYLTVLCAMHLIRAVFVTLIDLDVAWDTGLLAWTQLACPLVRTFATATKIAVSVLSLTLCAEILASDYDRSSGRFITFIHQLTANGRARKAAHIASGIVVASFLYGLVETVYWRVQYYPSAFIHGSQRSHGGDTAPIARCEIAGYFQYLFGNKVQAADFTRVSDFSETLNANARLASSYAEFKWVSGITVECALSLVNIYLALALLRNAMMNTLVNTNRSATNRQMLDRTTIGTRDIKFIVIIGLIQGLCRLPEALLLMLEPLTRPGEVRLTDAEIEMDDTWKRYFMMVTAHVVVHELSDLPAALILPICLGASRRFQRDFCQLFGFGNRVAQPYNMQEDHKYRSTYAGTVRSPYNAAKHHHSTGTMGETDSLMTANSSQRYVPMDTVNGGVHSEQPRADDGTTMTQTANVPRWKWSQGWVARESRSNQSDPMLNPLNLHASQSHLWIPQRYLNKRQYTTIPADQFQWYPKRTYHDGRSFHPIQPEALHRRAASANDLVYEPTNAGNIQQRIPVHGSCEAEWFEPRSYV
ncbi:unnamed protein product [Dicrocoelium dendriticum]|nr:unnamed protein product [Dicrocoelium dendriticum]